MVRRLLFVCVSNSFRSQIAEGYARSMAPKGVLVRSGGLSPVEEVDPMAIMLMAEDGVDIYLHRPKDVDLAFAGQADWIVVMGCDPEEACPADVLHRVEEWSLPDPDGMEYEDAREVRDGIKARVRDLMEQFRGQQIGAAE